MQLRTDKISGIVTLIFGLAMTSFGAFGLLIVALQRAMFSMMELGQDPESAAILGTFDALHRIWFVYLPLMIAGGMVYCIAGYYLYRGSAAARRIAQLNACCGYLWIMMYQVRCYEAMDTMAMGRGFTPVPPDWVLMLYVVATTLFCAAFPTTLLYMLSRPQERACVGA